MSWRFVKLLAAVGAILVLLMAAPWVTTCSAVMILGQTIPLSQLVDDGMVVVGDKKFTDFTYDYTGDMPDANGVNVIPIKDDDGNFGIRFQGAFTDLASTQGGSDAFITYNVQVTDPRFLISDAHLSGNPVLPSPDRRGVISVTETFLPLGAAGEYTMTIYDDEQIGTPKMADWVDFVPPVKMLSVQKDILVFGIQGFPAPTLSFVDQTFSQIDVEVPEATTMALAFIGIVGLGLLMRYGDLQKRRRQMLCPARVPHEGSRTDGMGPNRETYGDLF